MSREAASRTALSVETYRLRHPCGALALDDITFSLRTGEFCVLLGPSGAGKSTLLRAIVGLGAAPEAGRIRVDGARSIGMVHQGDALVSRLSALDNVLAAGAPDLPLWRGLLNLYPEAMQRRAMRLLALVGLNETHAHAPLRTLSGGEQQRVGVARALYSAPKLLLADEPVAQLDPAASTAILTLLKSSARDAGAGALCSLHQVDLARIYADRILAMRDGRIVFDGPPDALGPVELDAIYASPEAFPSDQTVAPPLLRRAS